MIQSPAGYQGDVRIKRYLDFYQAGYGVAMLSSGTTAFTPASLFAASEPGGWYDPSDLTTLYQDAAGTTPVTAVEQPVGLVLDKSRGLVLGSELVTNGTFNSGITGWTNFQPARATISWNSTLQRLRVDNTTGTGDGYVWTNTSVTAGKSYRVFLNQYIVSGGVGSFRLKFYWFNGSSDVGTPTVFSTITDNQASYIATAPSGATSLLIGSDANGIWEIDNISVRELPGSHLSQSTAAARPVLSARVNLLTYTEDFTNAVWTTGTVNLAAPTKVSADEISFPAVTASNDFSVLRQVFTSVATDYVGSVELKAKAAGDIGKKVGIWVNDGSIVNSTFHTLTADWVRVTVTETTSANATSYLTIGVAGSGFGGGGNQSSCSVNIRRADLRPANAGVGLPAYQRVGAATDYDTTGFPLYLKFDGTDDFLQSSSINFTSTDEMNVFAGVRKLADTPVVGVITELSANLDLNSGSFALLGTRFDSRANSSQWLSKGTVAAPVNYDSFTTPSTRVFACSGDISGDAAVFRQNGTVAGTSSADQGTGNFGNYPLFVGARGGTNYRFNGQIYSLIIRGAATDAATITATETWVNDKTKAF